MIKPFVSLFSVLVSASGLLLLAGCGDVSDSELQRASVRPVKLITVGQADERQVHEFPAVIGASRISELSFQVAGKLQEFPVRPSEYLNSGALIAKLEQRDFESAVASAKAQYDNADSEYQRAVRLAAEDAIANNVLEQRKAQYEVSKALLDQAEKALADSVLMAPFSGVVAETYVENLQSVTPGQVILRLMETDVLEAKVDIPASLIARIPEEEARNASPFSFVKLDFAPDLLIEAKFEEATLIADAVSQTYAVSFSFLPPDNMNVLPGMNATVEIHRAGVHQQSRVAVPLPAISSDGNGHFVWVLNSDTMTVSKRAVELEPGVGGLQVVTSGLSVDEVIVGAGADYLSEGMEVRQWQLP